MGDCDTAFSVFTVQKTTQGFHTKAPVFFAKAVKTGKKIVSRRMSRC